MKSRKTSLPESLKSFVDDQVSQRGSGTSGEYVRELIRLDQDRMHLRGLLLAGAVSEPSTIVDAGYCSQLRKRAHRAAKAVPGRASAART